MSGAEKKMLTDEMTSVEETAAAWFLKLRSGETREDDPEYLAWLNESGAHADALDRVALAWSVVGDNAAEPEIVTARRNALARSAEVSESRWSFWRVKKRPVAAFSAIAASLAAVIAVSIVFFAMRAPLKVIEETRFATEIGETRVVTLADNSKVSLDASSSIVVNFTDERRLVELTAGQAFFDVAKDLARPFQVSAGGRVVTATGTAFNVELVGEDVLVTLVEGEVVVSENRDAFSSAAVAPSAPIEQATEHVLAPGEQLLASRQNPVAVARAADIEKTTAWRRGKLIFEDDPLPAAVERMNRYSRIRISVEDSDIAALGVSGVFNAGDTDAFVEALEAYFPVEARRTSRSVIELRARDKRG